MMDHRLKPSEKLNLLLTGKCRWDEATPAIQSWARLTIYEAAKTILTLDGRDKRRAALGKVPETLRPLVEAEVRKRFVPRWV